MRIRANLLDTDDMLVDGNAMHVLGNFPDQVPRDAEPIAIHDDAAALLAGYANPAPGR